MFFLLHMTLLNLFNISETRCLDTVPPISNADHKVIWVYENLYLPGTEVEYTCRDNMIMVPQVFSGKVCDDTGSYIAKPIGTMPSCVRGKFKVIYFLVSGRFFVRKQTKCILIKKM